MPIMNLLVVAPLIRLLVMTLVYLLTVTSLELSLLINEVHHLINQMLDLEEPQQVIRSNFLR